MYDFAQHGQQRFIDQEMYDDEYDEYLLWTSTSPHVMIRVNDPFQVSISVESNAISATDT